MQKIHLIKDCYPKCTKDYWNSVRRKQLDFLKIKNLEKFYQRRCIDGNWVWFLGWEDPLEVGMATYSSILSWRIPMDGGTWWATVHQWQRLGHDWVTQSDTSAWHSKHIKRCSTSYVIRKLQIKAMRYHYITFLEWPNAVQNCIIQGSAVFH